MVSIKAKDCLKKDAQQWATNTFRLSKQASEQCKWLNSKIIVKKHCYLLYNNIILTKHYIDFSKYQLSAQLF